MSRPTLSQMASFTVLVTFLAITMMVNYGLAGDSGAHSRPIIESVVHQDSAQDLTHADAHGHGLLGESAALTSDNDTSGSISCYQCNSFQNNGCEKNVTGRKEWLHPCPSKQGHPAVGCWVLTQKVEYTINNELAEHKRTFRQCAYIPPEPIHACIYRSGFGGDVNHCFCNTTGCNPANAIRSNPILAVLSTLAVVVLFFKASFLA